MSKVESSEVNGKKPQKITFGQLCVKKGFANQAQVQEALEVQRSLDGETGKHKPIGLIMLEMGILGTTELIEILKDLDIHPGAAVTTMIRKPSGRKSSK